MRADDVYAILKGKLVKLTEDIKSMGDWKPIQHKGTVQTADDLPADAKEGWMYNIATDSIYGAAGMNVVKTSDGWDPMGPIINMDLYLDKETAKKEYQPKGEYLTATEADKKYQKAGSYLSGTDKTLSVSGKAADAAAVGAKISVLNDIICGTPHTATVEEYLNRQRTGVVYQAKEWKSSVNPATTIEKLGVNALIPYAPSTDTVEGEDGYANRPEFQWWHGNYIRHDNEDYELTAIEGEDGYSETGTADVCSFGPMFYYRKEDKGDYYLWSWSDKPHEELGLKPFQKNADGSVPAYWLLSAFPSVAGSDGLPHSQPGKKILRNQSNGNINTNYQKKGKGYHGCGKERQTFLMIFNAIKGGQKSSRKISQGVNNWNFQYDAAEQRTEKATYFPVTAAQAANLEVGLCVSVGYGSNNNGAVNKDRGVGTMHSYADDVKILRIEDLASGNKAVYLDISEGFTTAPVKLTDTLNTPITMSSMHIHTGETKKVIGKHDGAAVSNTSARHPYRVQGVEYQVGAYQVAANAVMVFKSN